jgi:hypothetical protein
MPPEIQALLSGVLKNNRKTGGKVIHGWQTLPTALQQVMHNARSRRRLRS